MAKANNVVIIDGHTYKAGDELPDLGSFIKGEDGTYYGLSKDVSKLPKYDDMVSGVSAYCTDTGEAYMYEASTKEWIKQ